jgi:hypothetical protein
MLDLKIWYLIFSEISCLKVWVLRLCEVENYTSKYGNIVVRDAHGSDCIQLRWSRWNTFSAVYKLIFLGYVQVQFVTFSQIIIGK